MGGTKSSNFALETCPQNVWRLVIPLSLHHQAFRILSKTSQKAQALYFCSLNISPQTHLHWWFVDLRRWPHCATACY